MQRHPILNGLWLRQYSNHSNERWRTNLIKHTQIVHHRELRSCWTAVKQFRHSYWCSINKLYLLKSHWVVDVMPWLAHHRSIMVVCNIEAIQDVMATLKKSLSKQNPAFLCAVTSFSVRLLSIQPSMVSTVSPLKLQNTSIRWEQTKFLV